MTALARWWTAAACALMTSLREQPRSKEHSCAEYFSRIDMMNTKRSRAKQPDCLKHDAAPSPRMRPLLENVIIPHGILKSREEIARPSEDLRSAGEIARKDRSSPRCICGRNRYGWHIRLIVCLCTSLSLLLLLRLRPAIKFVAERRVFIREIINKEVALLADVVRSPTYQCSWILSDLTTVASLPPSRLRFHQLAAKPAY